MVYKESLGKKKRHFHFGEFLHFQYGINIILIELYSVYSDSSEFLRKLLTTNPICRYPSFCPKDKGRKPLKLE